MNIMKQQILQHESRKPTLQNLKDDQDRYPGSTAEETPVTMIGLQSVKWLVPVCPVHMHLSLCPSGYAHEIGPCT